MQEKNYALAAYYATMAGLFSWVTGFLIVSFFLKISIGPIGIMVKMFYYHVLYFYLYIAIFSTGYAIFLFFWLLYRPSSRISSLPGMLLGMILIVSVVSFPCGMLYQLQDMLEGFYPPDIWGKLLGEWRDYFPVGWMVVLMSVPLNILAVIGFFATTHFCVVRYERAYQPWLYRKLSKWNAGHPDRLFFVVGTLLFIMAIACGSSYIEYDAERLNPMGVHIPHIRPFGWLIIGMIVPIVEGLAMSLTFGCWIFKYIHRKLAWAVLFIVSFSMATFNIWNMLPQNVFIRTLGPVYQKSMRLQVLSSMDSFSDGVTIRGKFHCPGDLMTELKTGHGMNSDNLIPLDGSTLIIKPVGKDLYAFEKRPPFRKR